MRKLVLTTAVVALALFSGCNDKTIPTPSGEIPQDYVAMARAFAGQWSGTLSGGVVDTATHVPILTKGTFSIRISSVRPSVTFTRADGRGSDLVLPECGSKIGPMTSIEVHDAKVGTLIGVNFDFNPGTCAGALDGRTLMLQFTSKKGLLSLAPAIYAFQGQEQEYSDIVGWHTVFFNIFYTGQFTR